MWIKEFARKIKYGIRYNSESYIKHLKSIGIQIGDRTTIFDPRNTIIDETRPWMINIGNDVKITAGVTILTHGYDWSVLKVAYGDVLGSSGEVYIGNNVFIGVHSTILKGVHIGNNVIIGANSLVNKDIPDNCVAAGNPCKVLLSLNEYHNKRKKMQIQEATRLVQLYREKYHVEPDEYALREFFWLFSNDPDNLPDEWEKVNALGGNALYSNELLRKNNAPYKSFEDFLKSIK